MQRREESQWEAGVRGDRDGVKPGKSSQVLGGPLVPTIFGRRLEAVSRNDKGVSREGWMTVEHPGCKH